MGVDWRNPLEDHPHGCTFIQADIMDLTLTDAGLFHPLGWTAPFDFICASSPCEEFSVWGMPHFHPNPKYPANGIRLFNHTRELCELSGLPYVMENVRPAQDFVGEAVHNCGPFYLWGNAVPPLLITGGIKKGIDVGSSKLVKQMNREEKRAYRAQFKWNQAWSSSKQRGRDTAKAAEIPPELANCVADYAEALLRQQTERKGVR